MEFKVPSIRPTAARKPDKDGAGASSLASPPPSATSPSSSTMAQLLHDEPRSSGEPTEASPLLKKPAATVQKESPGSVPSTPRSRARSPSFLKRESNSPKPSPAPATAAGTLAVSARRAVRRVTSLGTWKLWLLVAQGALLAAAVVYYAVRLDACQHQLGVLSIDLSAWPRPLACHTSDTAARLPAVLAKIDAAVDFLDLRRAAHRDFLFRHQGRLQSKAWAVKHTAETARRIASSAGSGLEHDATAETVYAHAGALSDALNAAATDLRGADRAIAQAGTLLAGTVQKLKSRTAAAHAAVAETRRLSRTEYRAASRDTLARLADELADHAVTHANVLRATLHYRILAPGHTDGTGEGAWPHAAQDSGEASLLAGCTAASAALDQARALRTQLAESGVLDDGADHRSTTGGAPLLGAVRGMYKRIAASLIHLLDSSADAEPGAAGSAIAPRASSSNEADDEDELAMTDPDAALARAAARQKQQQQPGSTATANQGLLPKAVKLSCGAVVVLQDVADHMETLVDSLRGRVVPDDEILASSKA
ncbi:hypothetical protein H9P43_004691 [Blastocladiella emersonii ATCC 22665]|nr:hypothetical protein H9P43_004691 [Blastocladiella emersonii ATCC 22665]